ncbi:unnamed protein product [Mycena citricolor]|uniref:Uncharacterized protein n=1 Tax=Mycena citricolor TaxID=2018698 RepID=A0AAD2HQE1_9AGAR|nr:unnamed protein product [Mycena citricolor]
MNAQVPLTPVRRQSRTRTRLTRSQSHSPLSHSPAAPITDFLDLTEPDCPITVDEAPQVTEPMSNARSVKAKRRLAVQLLALDLQNSLAVPRHLPVVSYSPSTASCSAEPRSISVGSPIDLSSPFHLSEGDGNWRLTLSAGFEGGAQEDEVFDFPRPPSLRDLPSPVLSSFSSSSSSSEDECYNYSYNSSPATSPSPSPRPLTRCKTIKPLVIRKRGLKAAGRPSPGPPPTRELPEIPDEIYNLNRHFVLASSPETTPEKQDRESMLVMPTAPRRIEPCSMYTHSRSSSTNFSRPCHGGEEHEIAANYCAYAPFLEEFTGPDTSNLLSHDRLPRASIPVDVESEEWEDCNSLRSRSSCGAQSEHAETDIVEEHWPAPQSQIPVQTLRSRWSASTLSSVKSTPTAVSSPKTFSFAKRYFPRGSKPPTPSTNSKTASLLAYCPLLQPTRLSLEEPSPTKSLKPMGGIVVLNNRPSKAQRVLGMEVEEPHRTWYNDYRGRREHGGELRTPAEMLFLP